MRKTLFITLIKIKSSLKNNNKKNKQTNTRTQITISITLVIKCYISSLYTCEHSYIHLLFLIRTSSKFPHIEQKSIIHHLFTHSFIHSFIKSIIHSFNHSFIHSFIHSFQAYRIQLYSTIWIFHFCILHSKYYHQHML